MPLLTEIKSEATFLEVPQCMLNIKAELLDNDFGNEPQPRSEWAKNSNEESSNCNDFDSSNRAILKNSGDVPSEHFCFLCNRNFADGVQFANHLEQEPNLYHQCMACAQSFKFKRHFLLHKCDFIEYDDPVIKPISQSNNTKDLVEYACKFCTINNISKLASNFKTYQLYVEHVNKYHRAPICCQLCHSDFKDSFNDYLEHLESGHFIKLAEFDCLFPDVSAINTNTSNHLDRCGLCKFTTGNDSMGNSLQRHLLSHVTTGTSKLTFNEQRIYCTNCRMTFNYQHDFDVHLFSHVLDMHRAEPDNYQLCCPVCAREFKAVGEFSSHLNEDHLYFSCGICKDPGLGFQTGHLIEDHYKNEHLSNEVLKQIPNYEKKTLSLIRTIIENVFCSHCNRFFNTTTRLEEHLKLCLQQ